MFAAAPPLYVVALLIQVWWIPVRVLKLAGWDVTAQYHTDLTVALALTSAVMLIGASWELVRRSRDRVRIGMVVVFASDVVSLGLAMAKSYAAASSSHSYLAVSNTLHWVYIAPDMLGVIGLAVAAGRRALTTSSILIAVTVLQIVPLTRAIGHIVGVSVMYWFRILDIALYVMFAIIVIGVIAKQCYEPVRDHLQAARRFSLLAWLFAMRAAFACVTIAVGTSTAIVQIWVIRFECVLLSLVAVITWGIAQNQLPRMPRYSLHVALAGVMVTLALGANVLLLVFVAPHVDLYGEGTGVALESWQLAAAAIGSCLLIVALWRYAKYAPAIRRIVIGGTIVVAAATAFELFASGRAMWLCELVSCLAVIPAFRETAIALADDPLPTTADVFA